MANLNRALPSVDPSHFAMVPRSDVPRSTTIENFTHKTTFDMGPLVPIYVDEILPGDVHHGDVYIFARLNNLLFPLMDDVEIETFYFFVANRNLWARWENMMGAQVNPGDSIAYTVPQIVSPAGGFAVGSLYDFMGIPCVGQITGGETISVNALPLRAYNNIYNEWFRDQDLQNSVTFTQADGPDSSASYVLMRRCKRHDYFTSARPWPLKGGVEVPIPISGAATVKTNATALVTTASPALLLRKSTDGAIEATNQILSHDTAGNVRSDGMGATASGFGQFPSNLYADLSTATGATLNAMRLSIATQQFLEKDARGGTRYTEILRNHFGITPEDSRLDRPEYIGGGRSPLQTNAMPQTSATGLTGGTTPVGSLSGQAVVAAQHRFSYHATEHGYIIGLANVRAAITYQQGLHRMWTRQTRFDFYWPTFQNLGEQAIRRDEIYCTGVDADDVLTFGYQERWAEYRYKPSRISNLFRSTTAGNIDEWHMSQQFSAAPTLNTTFIQDTPPASRVLAAGAAANGMQILFDSVTVLKSTRPIPVYSVPGMDRF